MSESESDREDELRMYCILRDDIEIPMGKAMAQAGHAFVSALNSAEKATPGITKEYLSHAQSKVTLRAKNLRALERVVAECHNAGIAAYMVMDAGRTVFTEPTVTCVGVGPVLVSRVPKYIQKLRLL